MKRTLALWIAAAMLSVLLCGALTACGGGKPEDDSGAPGFGESSLKPEPTSQMDYSWELEWRDDVPAWYYEKKAVLADMTTEEACEYTIPFFLSGGNFFTDANLLDPQMMINLVEYENHFAWECDPSRWRDGWVWMTYDEMVEELQHYLNFDPEKVDLRCSSAHEPITDMFRFNCSELRETYPIVPVEDKWEGDRRIITIWYEYRVDPDAPLEAYRHKNIFTLEQNGDYIRFVSYERVLNESWTGN